MYRIIFKPSAAAWVVQLATLGIFWSTVKEEKLVKSVDRAFFKTQDLKFSTYEDALKYVYSVGLDQVYKDWANRPGWFTNPEPAGYQPVSRTPAYIVNPPRATI